MPVAASAIYFLNLQGDVLSNRLYRDGVRCFSVCSIRIISHLGETWCTPSEWKSREQKNSLHVPFDRLEVALSFTRDSVMFTSIIIRSNANANVACAFKFVVEAAGWFKYYFGGAFNEDAIHNNFVLIYEFLVEIMGFDYPPCIFKALHYSGRTVVPIFVGASYIIGFNACWQDSYGRYICGRLVGIARLNGRYMRSGTYLMFFTLPLLAHNLSFRTQHGRDSWNLEVYILELDSPDSR
ncbi:hypothetical protein CXB51_032859 [Gossypium anomalum]|uniref:Uncharacterized protein n=1 Tax=Gossypium anomalum TaxID=47600 RepID=A0A8J6CQB4_9ROSI|nr:hypothetical protein CXB51_032859 [Gossypium anomalum]